MGTRLFLRCGERPCQRRRGAGRRHDDAGSARKLFHGGITSLYRPFKIGEADVFVFVIPRS
jgi:hypothetical protein